MPHHSSILLTTLAYDMLNKLKKKFIRIFWQEGDKTSEHFRLIDGLFRKQEEEDRLQWREQCRRVDCFFISFSNSQEKSVSSNILRWQQGKQEQHYHGITNMPIKVKIDLGTYNDHNW